MPANNNLTPVAEIAALLDAAAAPVVLLEGSRDVAAADTALLTEFGERFARAFAGVRFRSGAAAGADNRFADGVTAAGAAGRLELILPKSSKSKTADGVRRISLDELSAAELERVCELTKAATPANKALIEFYETGLNGAARYRAQYLLRDALKVIGSERLGLGRATIGCFYLNSTKPGGGGTGHTIRVCELLGVPVVLQEDWRQW